VVDGALKVIPGQPVKVVEGVVEPKPPAKK
jgi:hypothetical protein